eukprot:TRINITY_DN21690_c0_g1_i1.p1 TRINITY_DN21690_c0_g1~~TRINITY_DN21690_c0_g1_i1.p1  ORF type:complete len:549 (-),score=70.24 TRINITY_DN21690_c0_g1_i1:419-2065(-)
MEYCLAILLYRWIYSYIDQRFECKETELNFKLSLESQLMAFAAFGSGAFFLYIAAVGSDWFDAESEVLRTYGDTPCTVGLFRSKFAVALVLSLVVLFLSLASAFECLKFRLHWELTLTFFIVVVIMFLELDLRSVRSLCGHNDLDPSISSSLLVDASTNLIAVIVIVSAVCLYMPLRGFIQGLVIGVGLACELTKFLTLHVFFGGLVFAFAVCLFLFAFHAALKFEHGRRKQWKALNLLENQRTILENQYEAACAVLHRFCDGLIQLDAECKILETSRSFPAMLLLPSDTYVIGKSFRSFLTGDQSLDFSPDTRTCSMQPVRLKSSNCTEFSANCFYVRFQHHDGSQRYLVGLVENEERLEGPCDVTPALPPMIRSVSSVSAGPALPVMPPLRENVELRIETASDSTLETVSGADAMEIEVELRPGLPIRAHTMNFSSQFELLSANAFFTELFADEDQVQEFNIYVAEAVKPLVREGVFQKLALRAVGKKEEAHVISQCLMRSITLAKNNIHVRFELAEIKRRKRRGSCAQSPLSEDMAQTEEHVVTL